MDEFPTSSSDAIMNTIAPIPPMATGRSPPGGTHDNYWKRDSPVNAVSFGFIATAVFISVFLVVAIFERFLRRSAASPGPSIHDEDTNDIEPAAVQSSRKREGGHDLEKSYVTGVSVLMPGQVVPTFIANPIPLSCSNEEISWRTQGHANLGSCSFGSSSTPCLMTKSNHEENGKGLV